MHPVQLVTCCRPATRDEGYPQARPGLTPRPTPAEGPKLLYRIFTFVLVRPLDRMMVYHQIHLLVSNLLRVDCWCSSQTYYNMPWLRATP